MDAFILDDCNSSELFRKKMLESVVDNLFDQSVQRTHELVMQEFRAKIRLEEDKPLFDEAITAFNGKAYRAAFIMLWLACAESLKWRYKEAKKRGISTDDNQVKQEKDNTDNHDKDKRLLESAKTYGYLDYLARKRLGHILDLRNTYAHSNEVAPTSLQVVEAAESIVDCLLSQPLKLGKLYCDWVIQELVSDVHFIGNTREAVSDYVQQVIQKIADSRVTPMLMDLISKVNGLAGDPEKELLFNKGIWFCQAIIKNAQEPLLSDDEWHQASLDFRGAITPIALDSDIVKLLGDNARYSVVSFVTDKWKEKPKLFSLLEELIERNALPEAQRKQYEEACQKMVFENATRQLSIKSCYYSLCQALKSTQFSTNNEAVYYITNIGPKQIGKLNKDEQIELGHCVLRASNRGANYAVNFINELDQKQVSWPEDFRNALTAT